MSLNSGSKYLLNVGVVGAGIGGLVAALCFSRKNCKVTVIEKTELKGEAGAGIQLSPNCLKVLFDLGLEPQLRHFSSCPKSIDISDWKKGRIIKETRLNPECMGKYGLPYYHIHRGDLLRILRDHAQKRNNIDLELNSEVVEVTENDEKATLILDSGLSRDFDVIVGADGINSAVAKVLGLSHRPQFTGNVAWRALVPKTAVARELDDEKGSLWLGPGKHFVHYPVRKGDLVNCICVAGGRDWRDESWITRADLAELTSEFSQWNPALRALINKIEEGSLFKWALFHRPSLSCWHKKRTVLLGDACHATLPFLAQGAAMAIEDASVLSSCMERDKEISAAFATYQKLRRPRVVSIQRISRVNELLFHSNRLLAPLRDLILKNFSGYTLNNVYKYNALSAGD
ncbi:MAG: hypothetical protein CMQ40_02525 [Gammaproteobacteria bacterium]|nr:hypothetical protein [Gammaproteobacteria bacterium]